MTTTTPGGRERRPSYTAPFKIHTGETLDSLVEIGCTAAEATTDFTKARSAALKAGHTIVYPDGIKVWRTREVWFDATKAGSDAYTWDKDGDKVRCDHYEYTKTDAGTTRKKLRVGWMVP